MQKVLSACFGFGILGAFLTTWIAPKVIAILFTAPVSFGTNCEPAANWATEKLIASQLVGLVGGMLATGIYLAVKRIKSKSDDIGGGKVAEAK